MNKNNATYLMFFVTFQHTTLSVCFPFWESLF